MRNQAKVCACGAKNHQKWRTCQRCGADLAAGPVVAATKAPTVADVEPSRLLSGWVIAAGIAVLVIGAAIGFPRGNATTSASKAAPTKPAGTTAAAPAALNARASAPGLATGPTVTELDQQASVAYAGGDLKSALDALRRAVAADPGDLVAQNNLGQVLVRVGQAPEAIPHLTIAANGAPLEWSYRFNLARALGQTGDWSGAVESYRQADQLFPNDHVTLFNLAQALQKANRQDEALPVLEKAVAAAPEDPSFLLSLGSAYEQAGRAADAADTFNKYLDKAPTAPDAAQVRAHLARLQSAPPAPAPAPAAPGESATDVPASEPTPAPPSN